MKNINIYFTFIKEGREPITCGITPLDADYLRSQVFRMSMEMGLQGWRMDEKSDKKFHRIIKQAAT